MQNYNPSTWEAEIGKSLQVQSQPELHRKGKKKKDFNLYIKLICTIKRVSQRLNITYEQSDSLSGRLLLQK